MGTSFSSFANEPPQRDEPQQMDDELVDVEGETIGNDNTTRPVNPQIIRDIQGIHKSVELEFADDIMLAIIYNILAHDFTHDYGSNMNDRLNGIVHVIVKLNVYLDIQIPSTPAPAGPDEAGPDEAGPDEAGPDEATQAKKKVRIDPSLQGPSLQGPSLEGGNHWDYTTPQYNDPTHLVNIDITPPLNPLVPIYINFNLENINTTEIKLTSRGPPAQNTRSKTNELTLIYNNIQDYIDEFIMYSIDSFIEEAINWVKKRKRSGSSSGGSRHHKTTRRKKNTTTTRRKKKTRRTHIFASTVQNFYNINDSIKNVLLHNFIITKKRHLNFSKLYFISYLVYSYFDKNTKIHPIDRFNSNAFRNILTLLFFKNVFIENDFTKITNMVYDVFDVIKQSEQHNKYNSTTSDLKQNTSSSLNILPIVEEEKEQPLNPQSNFDNDSAIGSSPPLDRKKLSESKISRWYIQSGGVKLTDIEPYKKVFEQLKKDIDIIDVFNIKIKGIDKDEINENVRTADKYKINIKDKLNDKLNDKPSYLDEFEKFIKLMNSHYPENVLKIKKDKLLSSIEKFNNFCVSLSKESKKTTRIDNFVKNIPNKIRPLIKDIESNIDSFFTSYYNRIKAEEEKINKKDDEDKAKMLKNFKKAQEKAERAEHGDATASPIPRYICRMIVQGVLKYFDISNIPIPDRGPFLQKQYEILVDISNGKNITRIDNNLLDFFKTSVRARPPRQGTIISGDACVEEITKMVKQPNISIINNAGDLNEIGIDKSKFRDKLLCPPSSILDGMATCSYIMAKTRDNNIVEESMYFSLKSTKHYYNGYSHLQDDKNTIVIGFECGQVVSVIDVSNITSFKQTQLSKSNTLTASVVFKTVCDALSDKYKELSRIDTIQKSIEEKRIIYSELLLGPKAFLDIVKLSAMKNIGDFFQQINMIAKNGGFARQDVPKFAESKTIIGTNHDRPAAVIGMIMAMHTLNREVLRTNLLIGYLHGKNSVFYKRNAGAMSYAAAVKISKKKGGSKRVKKHTRKKIKN